MSTPHPGSRSIRALAALSVLFAPRLFAGQETVDVGASECLVVISRTGSDLKKGQIFATAGQMGIRDRVFTAGRYLLDPDTQTWEKHPLIHIGAGSPMINGATGKTPEVGVVTALLGDPLPDGQILAEPGQRGIQRRVLTPGNYALNPYAFKVEVMPATVIAPGQVGVVTRLVGSLTTNDFAEPTERGIQKSVLAPGTYFLNPYEVSVTRIAVGFRELTFDGPLAITFPSSDSYPIQCEVTVVWGILASDAPHLVKRFGSESNLIDRVLKPQVEYIIRSAGSDLAAKDFVDGAARGRFQQKIQDDLKKALEAKNVRAELALVRSVDVPEAVRKPIQVAKIAEEETLTNKAREQTISAHTELVKVTSQQQLVVAEAKGETERLVGEERSRALAEASRINADFELEKSRFAAENATAKAEIDAILDAAKADAERLVAAAKAEAEAKRVALFGSSDAYALYRFATHLSDNLKFELNSPATQARDVPTVH